MNKRIVLIKSLILATVVCSAPVGAQTPLAVEYLTKMKFGSVASTLTGGGNVIISPSADTSTITGSLIDFGGVVKRGKFKVTGEPKTWVVITMPPSFVMTKGTSSHTVTVNNFTLSTTNPVKLNKNGIKTIRFGATMNITPNQKKGTYKNEVYNINVEYQ